MQKVNSPGFDPGSSSVTADFACLLQGMQSRDSCVQRETSSSITLLPTGTIKVQVKSCAW